jgi:hypothetical protein
MAALHRQVLPAVEIFTRAVIGDAQGLHQGGDRHTAELRQDDESEGGSAVIRHDRELSLDHH